MFRYFLTFAFLLENRVEIFSMFRLLFVQVDDQAQKKENEGERKATNIIEEKKDNVCLFSKEIYGSNMVLKEF